MNTVRLGRTGFQVSGFGCGGITFVRIEAEEVGNLARHCYEHGVNWFEVGRGYVGSEKKLGPAVKPFRDKVILASKTRMRDARGAAKDIESSLWNLKTDYIDLYQFHEVNNQECLDAVIGPGGAYEALDRARSEGKIRKIGISCHNLGTAVKACKTGLFDTLQVSFNFIETETADEVFRIAADLDIGVILMKVMGGGIFDRADLAFRFVQPYSIQYPNIAPLVGFLSTKEVDEVLDLYNEPKSLTEAEWAEIEGLRAEIGKKFCHRCEYCLPCEQGINIPMAMHFRIVRKLWNSSTIISVFQKEMENTEKCTGCGACVDRCPYELEIPDLLKEYRELFKDYVKRNG